jgi:hypothetical protein
VAVSGAVQFAAIPLFYVTLLYESGADPLVAMKMAAHRDYQTTNHLKEDSLKKATADMATVFKKRKMSRRSRRLWVEAEKWVIIAPGIYNQAPLIASFASKGA